MIAIPANDSSAQPRSLGDCLAAGLPRAYSILFFSPDIRLGWLLLAVTFIVSQIGLTALAGTCAAAAIAFYLGYDTAQIRNGYMLFNPMLVCLILACIDSSYHFAMPVYLSLWAAAVLGGLFMATALQQWFGAHFALSAQSIPSVLSGYVLYFVAFAIAGPMVTLAPECQTHGSIAIFSRRHCRCFSKHSARSCSSPASRPASWCILALATTSPLTTLIASATFMTGALTMRLLGFQPGTEGILWCGYNFLLCGIALGTAYFAPSRGSLLLALAATFLCALVATALSTAPGYFLASPRARFLTTWWVLTLVYAAIRN